MSTNKRLLIIIIITLFLLATFMYGNMQVSDQSEDFPEFETTSEDIMNYQDSSGENYIIKKITYINRCPTRNGYHRLNIISDKNGYVFGDAEDFYSVESIFNLGAINEDTFIYAVVYCNGREFLALANNQRVRFLEYTQDEYLNIDYLEECYNNKYFDDLFLYLTQNTEEIYDKYLLEQIDDENISEFIEIVSFLI
ncbi:MAG: hypothetical protein J6A37_09875 [Oscillospiraceae bacterium]|nr:hypothetical protein [Oscillospiraceae bacterium]